MYVLVLMVLMVVVVQLVKVHSSVGVADVSGCTNCEGTSDV